MKRYEFKVTLFGVEKIFKINGKNYDEARKNLDKAILENLKVTSHKEVVTDPIEKMFDETSKNLDKMFEQFSKNFDSIFGGKKD